MATTSLRSCFQRDREWRHVAPGRSGGAWAPRSRGTCSTARPPKQGASGRPSSSAPHPGRPNPRGSQCRGVPPPRGQMQARVELIAQGQAEEGIESVELQAILPNARSATIVEARADCVDEDRRVGRVGTKARTIEVHPAPYGLQGIAQHGKELDLGGDEMGDVPRTAHLVGALVEVVEAMFGAWLRKVLLVLLEPVACPILARPVDLTGEALALLLLLDRPAVMGLLQPELRQGLRQGVRAALARAEDNGLGKAGQGAGLLTTVESWLVRGRWLVPWGKVSRFGDLVSGSNLGALIGSSLALSTSRVGSTNAGLGPRVGRS
eukprot:scaffold90816_cov63-Phaeocystis_antarctica.AAC.1